MAGPGPIRDGGRGSEGGPPGRASVRTAALVALVCALPLAPALVAGGTFFFRDLSRYFFPLRLFALEGIRAGELRYWNPYVHEGAPVSLPPLSYPLDLLQLLAPTPAGISLVLALHVPLAGLTFLALGRGLGLGRLASAAGAGVYALGGFTLSCLSLYVFLQAVAWAPVVVLAIVRAARGGPRSWALGALAVALAASTTGVEILAQALLAGALLAAPERRRAWIGPVVAVTLGAALAAPTLLYVAALTAGSARAQGFSAEMTLAFSVHPLTLIQTVVGDLHGRLADLANRFWGGRFFPGFPYVQSLYLGASTLALAAVGLRHGGGPARRLALLAAFGVLVSLGSWARLDLLLDAVPLLLRFRFPVKAFFTAHLAVALLAAKGVEALRRQGPDAPWRDLASLGLALGVVLASPLALTQAPEPPGGLFSPILPAGDLPDRRGATARAVSTDAATGGVLALGVGLVALLVRRRLLTAPRALAAVMALGAADLVRTGAGLNPAVPPRFYDLSPEMVRVAETLRSEGGRLFTCEPSLSRTFHRVGRGVRDSQAWSAAVHLEALVPLQNLPFGVPTAYSRDLTMLVPTGRLLSHEHLACAEARGWIETLRGAGVRHVLSLTPLDVPGLRPRLVVRPRRIAPLELHLHSVIPSLPLRAVATRVRLVADAGAAEALAREQGFLEAGAAAVEGAPWESSGATGRVVSSREGTDELEIVVEADRPTVLVVRDAYAPGWTATVDGAEAPVLRVDGRHRGVPVGAGRRSVALRYRPPAVRAGLAVSAAALAAAAALFAWRRRSA